MAAKKTLLTLPPILTPEALREYLVDVTNKINDLMNGICVDRPMFCVYPASDQENFAADAWVDIAFGTELFDVGSNFSTPSFTAPLDGKYMFFGLVRINTIDIDASSYTIRVTTSNTENLFRNSIDSTEFNADLTVWTLPILAFDELDKDETAKCQVYQDGGAAQADIDTLSFFGGFLVG